MSNLSQFYSTLTSGFIDVEIFILSGGGGGGTNGPGGGQGGPTGGGGGGAVYYGMIQVAPGTTCPIQIGAGGAGNTNHADPLGPFHGGNGGYSVFTTPTGRYRVAGGGGGAGAFAIGSRGGCSGGDHYMRPLYPVGGFPEGPSSKEALNGGSFYSSGGDRGSILGYSPDFYNGGGGGVSTKNGMFFGNSGGGAIGAGSYNYTGGGGAGGSGGGGTYYYGGRGVYTHLEGFSVNSARGYLYGSGGNGVFVYGDGRINQGEGGDGVGTAVTDSYNGSSGVIILNYPTQFGAASVTGSGNGAISFSDQWGSTTPTGAPNPIYIPSNEFTNPSYGVRGYKFVNSGSITFP